jgi:hypothetical protein
VIPCFARHDLSAVKRPGPAAWAPFEEALVPVAVVLDEVELVAELPHAANARQIASAGSARADRMLRPVVALKRRRFMDFYRSFSGVCLTGAE